MLPPRWTETGVPTSADGVDAVTSGNWWARAAWAVLRHPALWGVAVAQALRLAPAGWWRRPPFLPLPDPAYLRFRLETQYGSDHEPEPQDVVTYLVGAQAERANVTLGPGAALVRKVSAGVPSAR